MIGKTRVCKKRYETDRWRDLCGSGKEEPDDALPNSEQKPYQWTEGITTAWND